MATRALSGQYDDNSLRAIAIQATVDAGTAPVLGQLQILPSTVPQPSWSNVTADSALALIPTDPKYLISTGLFGPAVPVAETLDPKYESNFVSYADGFWLQMGPAWETANYYDRALNHYVYWARSGDPKWFFRATALARDYRRKYIEANNYLPSPHWAQMEGLALSHWLAGDDSAVAAVVRSATRLTEVYTPDIVSVGEGRITARMVIMSLLSWELGDRSQPWRTRLDDYVRKTISTIQQDGSYIWPNWCSGQSNYMAGMLNDAMIKYYERINQDPSVITAVAASTEYMWRTQWNASVGAFRYVNKSCTAIPESEAGQIPTDLNGLILVGFAFGAKHATSPSIRAERNARVDSIAASMVDNAWIAGSKQFNQSYYYTHAYMWYRK
ncbi:MAG: hypothetical protein K2R93_09675 [Gemmatimonadaceae bacterium]|nr:hypothetical protein [Gemmatimonadaceae bacterium]